jgi:hypothetical protein
MRTRRFPNSAHFEREVEADTAPANGVGLDLLAWVEGTDGDGSGFDGDAYAAGSREVPAARDQQESPPSVDARRPSSLACAPARALDKGRDRGEDGEYRDRARGEDEAWALVGWLLANLWPVLRACRGSTLALVSLSLTGPPGQDVRGPLQALASLIDTQPDEGAVFVLDRRPRDGAEHWYALALVHDPVAVVERWCSLTGASDEAQKITPVTGWPEHLRGDSYRLRRNVANVIGYALDPWPVQHGRRDLDSDVIACGVLAAPWRAVLSALRGEGAGGRAVRRVAPREQDGGKRGEHLGGVRGGLHRRHHGASSAASWPASSERRRGSSTR